MFKQARYHKHTLIADRHNKTAVKKKKKKSSLNGKLAGLKAKDGEKQELVPQLTLTDP